MSLRQYSLRRQPYFKLISPAQLSTFTAPPNCSLYISHHLSNFYISSAVMSLYQVVLGFCIFVVLGMEPSTLLSKLCDIEPHHITD